MADKFLILTKDNELVAEDPETGDQEPVTFEMLALPEAKEGDEAPSARSVAIDTDEGVLLVPEEDGA